MEAHQGLGVGRVEPTAPSEKKDDVGRPREGATVWGPWQPSRPKQLRRTQVTTRWRHKMTCLVDFRRQAPETKDDLWSQEGTS